MNRAPLVLPVPEPESPRALTTVRIGPPGLGASGLRVPRDPSMWPGILGSHRTWTPLSGLCELCPHHDDKGPEQGSSVADSPAPSAVLVLKMLVNKWLLRTQWWGRGEGRGCCVHGRCAESGGAVPRVPAASGPPGQRNVLDRGSNHFTPYSGRIPAYGHLP